LGVIAIAPDEPAQTQEYLGSLGLEIPDVRRVVFKDVKVAATPTLTVVNRRGIVENAWVGKLSPEGEREVLTFISQKAGRARGSRRPEGAVADWLMSAREVSRLAISEGLAIGVWKPI
jgi:hypothetical protein